MFFPLLAVAAPVDVVELVNFQCPHCRHFDRYVSGLSKDVAATGGVYRMAPVLPALTNDPAVSVRFWYALEDISGERVADKAAKYLYLGYQKGATLNSVSGVESWLSDYMTGLPSLRKLRKWTYGPEVKHQWLLAVAWYQKFPSHRIPEFVLLNPDAYRVEALIQRGVQYPNAARLYARLSRLIHRYGHRKPASIELPWSESH